MGTFQKTLATLRTFSFKSIEEITTFSNQRGLDFSEDTLVSIASGKSDELNQHVIEGVAKLYNISEDCLVNGEPESTDIFAIFEVGQGRTAYLLKPLVDPFTDYVINFEPDNEEFEEEFEDEYEDDFVVDENIDFSRYKLPTHAITFNGITVGFAISEKKATWIEEVLIRTAKHMIKIVPENSKKHLVKLNKFFH